MTQTTALAPKPNSNGTSSNNEPPARFTTIQPRRKKSEKFDRKSLIQNWSPKTNIIDRIKKIPTTKIQTFVIECNPETALDILTLNDIGKNRLIDESQITEYVAEMKSGNFPPNGDTVRIDWDYVLLDGQHRLWAIWESGKTMDIIIVTGLDPKTRAYMDIGKKRSASDICVIGGFGTNNFAMAAAVKNILYYTKTGKVSSSLSNKNVPNRLVQDFIKKRTKASELNEWIEFGKKANTKVKNWLSPSQWAFVAFWLDNMPFNNPEKSKKRVREFLLSFIEGDNLRKTDPILKLRNVFMNELKEIIKNNGKKNKIAGGSVTAKIKFIFAAWDLWFKGEFGKDLEVDLKKDPVIPRPLFR